MTKKKEIMEYSFSELCPKHNGRYLLVKCPVCGHHEAYVWIDDIIRNKEKGKPIPIRCNRLNECGETTLFLPIQNEKGNTVVNISPQSEEESIGMTKNGAYRISTLIRYLQQNGCDYPESWRGISKRTLESNQIVFYSKGLLSYLENMPKDYTERFFKPLYDRDIFIPIEDDKGNMTRVLLRSTHLPKKEKLKEVTMRISSNSFLIWNIKDMLNEKFDTIFITEGVPDALSVKECNTQVGVIALPGVGNYKRVLEFLDKHPKCKKKHFVICFDNDKAGQDCSKKLQEGFMKRRVKFKTFDLGSYGDMNDYLQANSKGLKKNINKILLDKTVSNTTPYPKRFVRKRGVC